MTSFRCSCPRCIQGRTRKTHRQNLKRELAAEMEDYEEDLRWAEAEDNYLDGRFADFTVVNVRIL